MQTVSWKSLLNHRNKYSWMFSASCTWSDDWREIFMKQSVNRSTRRVQTSLADPDHYSHTAHCKNVEPWWWKANHKVLNQYLHHNLFMLQLLFFGGGGGAHLLILGYANHHQNLISSSLYHPGPIHKILSHSMHNFLSNVVHKQTDRQPDSQTNQRYQKHNLLLLGR